MNHRNPVASPVVGRHSRPKAIREVHASSPIAWAAEGVVGVTVHNQARQLKRCLRSIHEQRGLLARIAVLVLDDSSTDDLDRTCAVDLARHEHVLIRARCGNPARARNTVLDFVDEAFPSARWVARLDADDCLADSLSLAAATRPFSSAEVKFTLGGNRLRVSGRIIRRINPATERLLDPAYLLQRLEGMAAGQDDCEIPSCNLVMARGSGWRYPEGLSGEDHWLVARLLLRHAGVGRIVPNPLYAVYSLEGAVTRSNRKGRRYLTSRRRLLGTARRWTSGSGGLA